MSGGLDKWMDGQMGGYSDRSMNGFCKVNNDFKIKTQIMKIKTTQDWYNKVNKLCLDG